MLSMMVVQYVYIIMSLLLNTFYPLNYCGFLYTGMSLLSVIDNSLL